VLTTDNAVERQLVVAWPIAPVRHGLQPLGIECPLQLVGLVPFVGDWIALSIILTGVGAVFVTYFGATRFDIEALPGLAPTSTDG
jgi:hypothetical protein